MYLIISKIEQTPEDAVILRLLLLIIANLLPYIVAGLPRYLFV